MYIIDVTPFSKSIRNDAYSYFCAKPIEVGSIVTVPLKNKSVKGLVIATRSVKDLKSELRNSEFALKKVKTVSKNTFFEPAFIETLNETANYFATSVGSIIESVIPKVILSDINKFKIKKGKKNKESKSFPTKNQKYLLQTTDSDRYSEYKSIIREQFARNNSVIFIVPTIEDCQLAEKKLSRGIEQNTLVLNSGVNAPNFFKIWQQINGTNRPILLITTPKFMCLPIQKIGIIIIERENSTAYRTQKMPYLDLRFFCEKYAEKINVPLLYGDLMLRTETLKRYDEHLFFEYSPIKFRLVSDAEQKLVDLKDQAEIINEDNPISKSLLALIEDNIEQNDHLFILNNRKGLSPLIVCNDCGEIVKCLNCDSPVMLYGKDATEKSNYFYCQFCGSQRHAGEVCHHCSSWKLKSVGFGTDKVRKEIQKHFPNAKVFLVDKDHTKTSKQIQKIIKDFYESPSAILIGTELALLYLSEEIENVAISSIDSMFSSPDFKISERILNILLRAKTKARKNFLVQSRNLDNSLFRNLKEGNLNDFYREEFLDRQKYNFPPFCFLIKISTVNRDVKKALLEIEQIKEQLDLPDLITFESKPKRNKGLKTAVGILRIDRKEWPNQKMIEKFKSLPPKFKLEIDAESLF